MIEIVLVACHFQNYFVITYPLEDQHELSLGMLIRPKRIYNFLCSMLCFLYVFPCFPYVFLRFPDVFMDKPINKMPKASSCFRLFLYFRKALKKIFAKCLEKLRRFIFARNEDGVQRRAGGEAHSHQMTTRRGHTPWLRHVVIWWPWPPPLVASSLINCRKP